MTLQEHVAQIRRNFEMREVPEVVLVNLYSKYNPIDNVELFVARAKKCFPKGACGLTSLYLREKMGGEVMRGKYGTDPHSFLLLNGQIVDITADQYGGPPIYIGPIVAPWSLKTL